jgi:hypothetical protein
MARPAVEPGADIDGFTVGECVHRGGMATLWGVTRPDIAAPLPMKIPLVSEGEDPAAGAAGQRFRQGRGRGAMHRDRGPAAPAGIPPAKPQRRE